MRVKYPSGRWKSGGTPSLSLSAFRHLSVRFWTIHAFVRMWASPNAICKHIMEYMRRSTTTSSTMMNIPYQSSRHGLRCCPCDGGRVAPAGTKLHRVQPHLPSMQLSFPAQFVRKPDTEHSGCSTRRNWSLFHEYGALVAVGGVYVLCRLPVEDILQAENINIPVNHVTVYSE